MLSILFCVSTSTAFSCPLYVKHTFFVNLTTSTNGSAIYLSVYSCIISLDHCLFQNDSTSLYGGAIYSDFGRIMVNNTCFVGCNSYHRGYSICTTNISAASLYMVSFYNCYSLNSVDGACNIQFISSNISLSDINFSFNYAGLHTTTVWNRATSNSSWYFTTIYNNTDTYGATMNNRGAANPYTFANLNVISNVPQDQWGLLFFDDNAKYVFYIGCVFYNNGNARILDIITSDGAVNPTFVGCLFDIAYQSVSSCTTLNCTFGMNSVQTIGHGFINIDGCQKIFWSGQFTESRKAGIHLLTFPFAFIQAGLIQS